MPRGVKGSGKSKATTKDTTTAKRPYHRKAKVAEVPMEAAIPDAPVAEISATPTEKTRKPYPTTAERIAMADKQVERLTKLNASRTVLVEKTAALLAERQDALAKSTNALEKAVAKKERLVVAQSKPPKAPKEKLSPEERKARMAAGRAAKKAETEKYAAIIAALKESGKSVDELLAELKG